MENQLKNANAVFQACTSYLRIGRQQVISGLTSNGHGRAWSDEGRKQTVNYLHKNIDGLDDETIEHFVALNRNSLPVSEVYRIDKGFTILSDEQLREIWHADVDRGWDRFRELYPDSHGTLEESLTGFNADETRALSYSGMQFDGLMGHGDYLHFKLTDSNWKLDGRAMAWIS
jgi:hypothetical protein